MWDNFIFFCIYSPLGPGFYLFCGDGACQGFLQEIVKTTLKSSNRVEWGNFVELLKSKVGKFVKPSVDYSRWGNFIKVL